MTTHRRYTFQHQGPWEAGGHHLVLAKLQQAVETRWWFEEPAVEGEAFNRLIFTFTVTARDRWWAHRRAMRLAEDCCYAIKMPVPEPVWEVLPPHTNRGRYRTVPASAGGGVAD